MARRAIIFLVELWIHDFKKVGERTLSAEEQQAFRVRALQYRFLMYFTASFTVAVIVMGLLVMTVPFEQGWGWLFLGFWTPLWIYSFTRISLLEGMSSLFSRAARKPTVWVWERAERPQCQMFQYMLNVESVPVGDEDELSTYRGEFTKEYGTKEWLAAEKFEKQLERMAGGPCDRFETRETDQAILSAEGRHARRVVVVYVLTWSGTEPEKHRRQSGTDRSTSADTNIHGELP